MEGKTEKWKNTQYDYDIYIHFLNLKKKTFQWHNHAYLEVVESPPELRFRVEVFGVCAGVAGWAPLF